MSLPSANRRAVVAACADMIMACGLTIQEIAEHLGVSPEDAPIAALPSERADAESLPPRLQEVLRRVDNPDGATVAELMAAMSLSMQAVFTYLDRLVLAGLAVAAKAPAVRAKRYFAHHEHAQRWAGSHTEAAERAMRDERDRAEAMEAERQRHAQEREAIKAQRQQEQQQRQADKQRRAAERAAAKVTPTPKPNAGVVLQDHGRLQMRGQAIETEATRRTIDSTNRPNNRIEAAPSLPPDPRWPSFAALRPGIDPATGKPWGDRS